MALDDFKKLYEKEKDNLESLKKLYSYYRYDENNIYIYGKKFEQNLPEYAKTTQRKLHNPFYQEIVDTKIDYILGNGLTFGFYNETGNDETAKEGTKKVNEQIRRFKKINDIDDLEWQTATYAAACGYCGRLIYTTPEELEDEKDRIKVIAIPPWETLISEDSDGNIEYSYRVYVTEDTDGQGTIKVIEYTDKEIIIYSGQNIDSLAEEERKQHLFKNIPFFKIKNNVDSQSDILRVIRHIDEYDLFNSNFLSEMKQFRDAIMVLTGGNITPETIKMMKETGVLVIPGSNRNSKEITVKWLIKDFPIDNFKTGEETLRKQINKFAQHVDFNEDTFAGNLTNYNITFRLMPLDIKATKYETKLISGLNYQFKILFDYWNLIDKTDIYDVFSLEYTFKRKKPVNKLEEAQVQETLKGNISEKTRLSQFYDIDDPSREIEEINKDKANELEIEKDGIFGES
jgi:SPP1 family phage portal protein